MQSLQLQSMILQAANEVLRGAQERTYFFLLPFSVVKVINPNAMQIETANFLKFLIFSQKQPKNFNIQLFCFILE